MEMDPDTEDKLSVENGDLTGGEIVEKENFEPDTVNQEPLNMIDDLFTNSTIENITHDVQLAATNLQTALHPEEDEERQATLSELVTHLEDTAALLRQYMAPPNNDFVDNISKSEKTNFLLKYQIVFVVFSQKKTIGAVLQTFNMILVIFATVVLSRQMLKYKIQGSFLAQTYIATVITFAGLYFIIYRFDHESWEFASVDKMEDSIAISQYIKMIYLSVSAATLCGAANIQPRTWYTIIILCFQSLINFVYFASILAQTIGNYNTYTVQVRRSASMNRMPRR